VRRSAHAERVAHRVADRGGPDRHGHPGVPRCVIDPGRLGDAVHQAHAVGADPDRDRAADAHPPTVAARLADLP